MIKPFYQGKLDTFCAVYAVLNAWRLLLGMRTIKARDILNETLLDISRDRAFFEKVLNQETDYMSLVDHMLKKHSKRLSYKTESPFAPGRKAAPEEIWELFKNWLGEYPDVKKNHSVVFRFIKYMSPDKAPLNRHWTTGEYAKGDYLHLFDSSHEAEAVLNVHKLAFVTDEKDVDKDHLIVIPPDSIRLLSI